MDDYQQNIDDNNNLSANSGANSGKSENNGQQDINSRHFLDKRIDKVISEIMFPGQDLRPSLKIHRSN